MQKENIITSHDYLFTNTFFSIHTSTVFALLPVCVWGYNTEDHMYSYAISTIYNISSGMARGFLGIWNLQYMKYMSIMSQFYQIPWWGQTRFILTPSQFYMEPIALFVCINILIFILLYVTVAITIRGI